MPGPNKNNARNTVPSHKHKMNDIITGNSGLGGAIKKTDSALEKGAVVATAFIRQFGQKLYSVVSHGSYYISYNGNIILCKNTD